mmetsp:Transcript_25282/g.60018  ORF Transcript_25282/g.60018 Transcript_25282/m.60018 type:complete len:255 (-) Transcript_25282:1114-1878(-)
MVQRLLPQLRSFRKLLRDPVVVVRELLPAPSKRQPPQHLFLERERGLDVLRNHNGSAPRWRFLSLLGFQEILLRANHRSWSDQPHPSDSLFRFEAVLVHVPQRDEGTCPSLPRLAMNCHPALLLCAYLKEALADALMGSCAISEEEIVMLDTCLRKHICAVHGLIEPNDGCNVVPQKRLDVRLRRQGKILRAPPFNWPAECNELLTHLIQASILWVFVVLVLIHIETIQLEPATVAGLLQALDTVQDADCKIWV